MNEATTTVTISEVYDMLPMSERTLWKQINAKAYSFQLLNDMGRVNWFRVMADGREIGVVQYYQGRKLCCHGITA